MSALDKAIQLYNLREKIDRLKGEISELNKKMVKLQDEDLPDAMAEGDLERITIKSIGRTLYLHSMLRSQMVDRAAGIDWLKDNGHSGIVIETVPWQTLDALVKELGTEEFPEELFKIREWEQARLRKT